MADTKVYLLDGGTLVIDGFHAFWNRGPAGELRFPCYAVLIEHADGRYVFDTGYDFDHVMRVLPFEKPIQDKAQTLPGQLAALGLGTDDINYVINSHYHFDHCGGNKHLHKACTLCHAKELEASGNCQPFEHLGYSDLTFAPEIARKKGVALPPDPALDMYTPKFETLTGDQEIAKGQPGPLTIRTRVPPKKGRLLVFDGSLLHAGNTPRTNVPRININFNAYLCGGIKTAGQAAAA